ncbi:NUDIX hydrolase [Gordonia oryzae]|uniref:NUDIX hydrolase n=2 Tax=Gordonia oryzae TaxID=2487349 RepID=A0A3N4GR80_9ACTN|nr:NUDIX hydrolase [Gordonia oryzae]
MAVMSAHITKTGLTKDAAAPAPGRRRRGNRRPERSERLRTVRETSAGGLVISDLDLPVDKLSAALIGRVDRRGRMMWSLPKGHIESGETAEQTAVREVAEETGIQGLVVAPLGKIDYWFVSEGRRIHKTVHHYLLRSVGGELSDADYEVSEVAWVPLHELPRRLTYSDERRLARMARGVIADLAADPQRLAQSEAESSRTEPNAYERAAAARNQRRNEPPPAAPSRRRRRRHRRPAAGDG